LGDVSNVVSSAAIAAAKVSITSLTNISRLCQ
jgi:hypothetical protein